MATTTTHYGFDIPQSTDLVKDGATAIATLGQDIDTAMNTALGTKKSGLVLLNTTSFSAVASQSINNVFSTNFKNYRLIIEITSYATTGVLSLRLRSSGTDNSSNNYAHAAIGYISNNSGTNGYSNGLASSFEIGYVVLTGGQYAGDITLTNPQATARTAFMASTTSSIDANNIYTFNRGGIMSVTTSYDGFTLIAPGNITGSVSTYGMNI